LGELGGAVLVEGDHQTSFVHDFERHERSEPELLVVQELRPPTTDAHCRDSAAHIKEPPHLQWPFLLGADGCNQCALLMARPSCLGAEARRDLLRYANPFVR